MTVQAAASFESVLKQPCLPIKGETRTFPVRRIYCAGRNYVSHIREMKEADERDPPFFFQKPSDAIVGDGATIAYPPCTDDLQYEVELVIAIGKGGRNIPAAGAHEHIYGYATGLDMTRRDRQKESFELGLPWEIGKSFDQSAPCGQIFPASATGHPRSGAIGLSVNGVQRQKGDLSEMIWNVPEIVSRLSEQYQLESGDLIFTGTPAGVGAVVTGDRIDAAVEGAGTLTIFIGPKE